jgi:fused signal recognition particle receptor
MLGFKKITTSDNPGNLTALARLRQGLARAGLGAAFAGLFRASRVDETLLEEIETLLLSADAGVEATQTVLRNLRARLGRRELPDGAALDAATRAELLAIVAPCAQPLRIPAHIRPFVILVVGVNGAGKTTTIGKLAKQLQRAGHSVLLAAGDTFRAAAVEQLQAWGARNNAPVIAQPQGADPASVIYDALQAAKARGADVLIADTSGRLHTQGKLMEELKKIKRVVSKLDPAAPHEIMLIVDGTQGQNALAQAAQFHQALGLTGITVTKLDGTAKGGMVFAIAAKLGVPLRYIGIGEGVDDLREFDAAQFVEALFGK